MFISCTEGTYLMFVNQTNKFLKKDCTYIILLEWNLDHWRVSIKVYLKLFEFLYLWQRSQFKTTSLTNFLRFGNIQLPLRTCKVAIGLEWEYFDLVTVLVKATWKLSFVDRRQRKEWLLILFIWVFSAFAFF